MEHERFTEWLCLSVFDELGEAENLLLEEHMKSCDDCRREREKIVGLLDSIAASGAGEPSEAMLASARQSLRAALWKNAITETSISQPALVKSFWARLSGYGRGYRMGLAAAATLAIGFLLGYVTFYNAPSVAPFPQEWSAPTGRNAGISEIQFLDVNATNGEVDVVYNQIRPVRLKTNVDDERARDILAYALLNDGNPGVRLKAISAFESVRLRTPPEDMKQAFLEALTSDPNAGVRLQALLVLRTLPFDEDVKTNLLFVLSHDENPGIRLAVMNYLAEITIEGIMPEQEMYDILGDTMRTDQHDSVRNRPVNRIEEVEQP